MKATHWIWRIVLIIVVLAAVVGGGFLVYRVGYARGMMAAQSNSGNAQPLVPPAWGRPGKQGFGPGQAPGLGHEQRGFEMMGFNRRDTLRHFGGFSPFSVVLRLVILGLGIWLVYKFFMAVSGKQGWQLTFQRVTPAAPENAAPAASAEDKTAQS